MRKALRQEWRKSCLTVFCLSTGVDPLDIDLLIDSATGELNLITECKYFCHVRATQHWHGRAVEDIMPARYEPDVQLFLRDKTERVGGRLRNKVSHKRFLEEGEFYE